MKIATNAMLERITECIKLVEASKDKNEAIKALKRFRKEAKKAIMD